MHAAEGPVFVFGSPRSGTSILAHALTGHHAFWTSGETHIIFDLIGEFRLDRAYARASGLSPTCMFAAEAVSREELLVALGGAFSTLFSSRAKGKRWVDHTPHYCLIADELAIMFPTARFVHIVRDGRRVVHSMVHFGRPSDQLGEPNPSSLPPWATNFTVACQTWQLYAGAAADFCRRQPERAVTVKNEDLILQPERTLALLQHFLGVPFQAGPVSCVTSHRINSSFHADSTKKEDVKRLGDPWSGWSVKRRRLFSWIAGQTLTGMGFATNEELNAVELNPAEEEIVYSTPV